MGEAWKALLSKHKAPVLHDEDQSHPTFAGSYLAACVFMAVLFKESFVGTKADMAELDAKDAALLHKVAWEARKSVK